MLALISTLVFAIPICLNLISLKYLYDVKNESNCEEINSPYINIFYDYYLVELCFLLMGIMILGYIFHNYKKISKNFKGSHIRLIKIFLEFFTKNKKIFELFTLFISGILIKLFYDIGNEKKCKDVDKYLRLFLFYGQIMGSLLISYNVIFK